MRRQPVEKRDLSELMASEPTPVSLVPWCRKGLTRKVIGHRSQDLDGSGWGGGRCNTYIPPLRNVRIPGSNGLLLRVKTTPAIEKRESDGRPTAICERV